MTTIDTARLEEMFDTPIGRTIEALQDEGRDIWIAGFGAHHALIVDADNNQVTVAPVGTTSGIGRWECSKTHYQAHTSIYHERFPIR